MSKSVNHSAKSVNFGIKKKSWQNKPHLTTRKSKNFFARQISGNSSFKLIILKFYF